MSLTEKYLKKVQCFFETVKIDTSEVIPLNVDMRNDFVYFM